MTRAAYLGASITVTVAATMSVMLLGGYYESNELLPVQLALIAGPIGLPLILASLMARGRALIWPVVTFILIVGWGYVVYLDTRPYQGGGASLAVVAGWMTSAVTLCVIAGWKLFARIRAISIDPHWQKPPSRE